MKKILFLLFFPVLAFAEEPRTQSFSLSEFTGMLEGQPLGPQVDCFDPKETPICENITNQFCNNLSANNGKVTEPTGTINIGRSPRSQLSELERANLVDLTRVLPRLPADMQAALKKPIEKLTKLVSQENDSRDWYRDVSRVREEINDKVKDVAKRRADVSLRARLPQGQRATDADKIAVRDSQERLLMETLSRAKTEASPNWGRIGAVYARVKQDMLAVIETLPLTPQEKLERIKKINETSLTPPFGVRVGGAIGQIIESDCRTNMINAMYMPFTGSLTVCGGFLNGYQSENAVYFTLAHELAHAFNFKQLQTASSAPRFSQLDQKLMETNSNLSCEEYSRLKDAGQMGKDNYNCGRPEYNAFMSCLNNNRTFTPANNGNATYAMYGNLDLCNIADRNQGLAFMNPNEFVDRRFSGFISSSMQEYTGTALASARYMLIPAYILTQEIRCRPGMSCQELSGLARARASFATNSPACIQSSDAGAENESDWYAHKALTLKLRSTNDIRARRELVASSLGLFCGYSYSRPLSSKDQARLEKEIQKLTENGQIGGEDNHSSNEDRIRSAMTEEMASLLQCTPPTSAPATASYQSCRI